MSTREVYAERKALRLCVACGTRDADPLVTTCSACRAYSRQAKEAWLLGHPHEALPVMPKLQNASNPRLVCTCNRGYTLCPVCTKPRSETGRPWAGARPDPRDLPGPNQLACCGSWQKIESIPFVAPCCHRIYFAEDCL